MPKKSKNNLLGIQRHNPSHTRTSRIYIYLSTRIHPKQNLHRNKTHKKKPVKAFLRQKPYIYSFQNQKPLKKPKKAQISNFSTTQEYQHDTKQHKNTKTQKFKHSKIRLLGFQHISVSNSASYNRKIRFGMGCSWKGWPKKNKKNPKKIS